MTAPTGIGSSRGSKREREVGRWRQDGTGALGRRIERAGHERECVSIHIL